MDDIMKETREKLYSIYVDRDSEPHETKLITESLEILFIILGAVVKIICFIYKTYICRSYYDPKNLNLLPK